jgi:hypothetical protein
VRKLFFLFTLLLAVPAALAQTVVSGTIVDQDGVTWQNAVYTFTLQQANTNVPATINGSTTLVPTPITGVANAAGTFSATLTSYSNITPANTSWLVTICPQTTITAPCVTLAPQIFNGTSVNFSAAITAGLGGLRIPVSVAGGARAYANVEIINPKNGDSYYNVVSNNSLSYLNGTWSVAAGGAVTSVNGMAGAVTLAVPTAVSQLARASTDYSGVYTTPAQAAAAAPVQTVNNIAPTGGNVTVTSTPASAGATSTLQLSGGSGNAQTADTYISASNNGDHSIVTTGPRVNVRDPAFAQGWTLNGTTVASCAGIDGNTTGFADPTDNPSTGYSECAITSALKWAIAFKGTHSYLGIPVVYLPGGTYAVHSTTLTSPITVTGSQSLQGDDAIATGIDNSSSPLATAVTFDGTAGNCPGGVEYCLPSIKNIYIYGAGHTTTGGGLEIVNVVNMMADNINISNVGGISLNIQGSAERAHYTNSEIGQASVAVNLGHNQNETYFTRVNVTDPGIDKSGHSYSTLNATNGVPHAAGTASAPTPWYPEPRAAVNLNGANEVWEDSSIKGLASLSGISVASGGEDIRISNTYFEGFPYTGGAPRINHAIEVIGETEIGHTTAAMTTTATTVPVDDAIWHRNYVNNPIYISSVVGNTYRFEPCDYLAGSTATSTCSGFGAFTRGTYEDIGIQAFTGDQNANFTGRALDGTTAQAWPVGTAFVTIPYSTYGTVTIQNNHINVDNLSTYGYYTPECSDTVQLPLTDSTNSEECDDVSAGVVPEGITQPFPGTPLTTGGPGYVNVATAVTFRGNSFYDGTTEIFGEGYIKVAGNANLTIAAGDDYPRQTMYNAADIIAGTYNDNNISVQYISWPAIALGVFNSSSANVSWNPSSKTFEGSFFDSNFNYTLSVFKIGNAGCTYYANATATISRFCTYPSAPSSTQVAFNNGWVVYPGASHTYQETSTNTLGSTTLAAAAAGTVPGDGVYRASCTTGTNVGDLFSGFNTSSLGTIHAQFASPLPPGVVYGFTTYTGGTDPRNGLSASGIATWVCNTGSASVTWTPGAVTLTQVQ